MGRTEATGQGVFFATREFVNQPSVMDRVGLSVGIPGKRVALQGYGNVGFYSARYFNQSGAKIVAISEYDGTIMNPDGLDIVALEDYWTKQVKARKKDDVRCCLLWMVVVVVVLVGGVSLSVSLYGSPSQAEGSRA